MTSNYSFNSSKLQTSRRRVISAAGSSMAALALAACGSGKSKSSSSNSAAPVGGKSISSASTAAPGVNPTSVGQPQQGGTITIATSDPAFYKLSDMDTALNNSIWHLIGKRALALDGPTKKLLPETVESWEIPGDGSQYILHVRKGVKTHNKPPANGREFTADDLAFNIERISGKLDPQNASLYQRATTMAGLDHADATDTYTCTVTMTGPTSTFLAGLTEIRNELMPKDVVQANLFSNIVALAGHGPFMTKDYQDAQVMTAVRHPDYFVSGQPHADQFQVLWLQDQATILSAFLSGKLDMFAPTKQQVSAVKASLPSAKYYTWPSLNWDHIRFQVEKPPFTDFRVRKAIMLAIDYASVANGYYGTDWEYTGPLEPEHPEGYTVDQIKALPGYNPDTKDKDRADAKQMMAAAGYPDGEITFQIMPALTDPTSPYYVNAINIQDSLKKVWPKMNVQVTPPSDSASYASLQAQGNFSTVSYTITTLPDAALELASQWHTTGGLLGSRNYGHFKNADADGLIEKAFATIDNDQRKSILQDFQKRYFEEWQPAIQICEGINREFTSAKLDGLDQVLGAWWYTGYRIQDRAGVYWKTG